MGGHCQTALMLLNGCNGGLGFDGDTFFYHLLMQTGTHVHIETTQDFFTAIQKRGLRSHAVEDASELDGDVTATDNDCSLRELGEVERLIGCDRMFAADKTCINVRRCANSDKDTFSCNDLIS